MVSNVAEYENSNSTCNCYYKTTSPKMIFDFCRSRQAHLHVKTPMARPGGGGPAIGAFGLRVCAIVREELSMSVSSVLHGSTKVLALCVANSMT